VCPPSSRVALVTTPAYSGEKASLQAPSETQADTAPFRLGNRPSLTGIRALAMSTVLVYHANFGAMPGSWVALQIFFVLSGFLITNMLAGEARRNGRVSLKNFYARRAVRLLPPLLLAVAMVAVYASLVHVWETSQRVWGDSLAALFYYADYRSALGHAPFLGFFAQAWSLSVEEQFYIIWAILFAVVVSQGRRRLAYWLAAAGLVLSTADRTWTVLSAPHFTEAVANRAYYAFDTRADALFFGCLLGLLASDGYLHRWPQWAYRLLTAAAAAAAVVFVWVLFRVPVFTSGTMLWWQPITTLASAVLIAYFVLCPLSLGTRFVGLGVFVFLGELSYTIYLVHFGVYLALEPGPSGTHWSFWPTELLRLAIILAISTASWFLVERPLARWRSRSAAR
jgi:peptidoglycan/LPS O-acetylase OafA/YrhL